MVKAAFDHLSPRRDKDVQHVGLLWPNAGWIDEHQAAQSTGVHNRHLGSNPTAQTRANEVHLVQATVLQKPVIEDRLVLDRGDPGRRVGVAVAWVRGGVDGTRAA